MNKSIKRRAFVLGGMTTLGLVVCAGAALQARGESPESGGGPFQCQLTSTVARSNPSGGFTVISHEVLDQFTCDVLPETTVVVTGP